MERHKLNLLYITSSRSEYGIIRNVLLRINQVPEFNLKILATGSHLATRFGKTVYEIQEDGFVVEKLDILKSQDVDHNLGQVVARASLKFSQYLRKQKFDSVILLGDRFEIYAAAQAAFFQNIPIIHFSGGDTSLGAIDDVLRSQVTLMSTWHFVKTKLHLNKVMSIGASKKDCFVIGAMALESIKKIDLMSKEVINRIIGNIQNKKICLVTFHPVTKPLNKMDNNLDNLLMALKSIMKTHFIVITGANQDPLGDQFNKKFYNFASCFLSGVYFNLNMGTRLYLSIMKNCDFVLGNSSSGILESGTLRVPVINIRPRQDGRQRNCNVVDAQNNKKSIFKAMAQINNKKFRNKIRRYEDIFDVLVDYNISVHVVNILKRKLKKRL